MPSRRAGTREDGLKPCFLLSRACPPLISRVPASASSSASPLPAARASFRRGRRGVRPVPVRRRRGFGGTGDPQRGRGCGGHGGGRSGAVVRNIARHWLSLSADGSRSGPRPQPPRPGAAWNRYCVLIFRNNSENHLHSEKLCYNGRQEEGSGAGGAASFRRSRRREKKAPDSANGRSAPCAWLARASACGQSGAQTAPAPTGARGRGRPRRIRAN